MLKFIFFVFIIAFSSTVIAQNNKELEVYVNGELEKIPLGKKNIFITAKGDTIEYSIDDILIEMMKNQPKKNDSIEMVEKINEEKKEIVNNQKPVDSMAPNIKPELLNNENQLKEKLEKEQQLSKEKLAAEKVSLENKQKEKEGLYRKKIEEQNAVQLKEKTKIVSNAQSKEAIELQYKQWVDSMEQAEEKGEELKTIAGKITYYKELYPANNKETEEIVQQSTKAESDYKQDLVTEMEKITEPVKEELKFQEKENVTPLIEKAEEPVKVAEAVLEIEKKKPTEVQKMNFEFKKYFLPDPLVTADNIGLMDTLKFINIGTSGNTVFPSMELGLANNFSLCYDYTVCNYHGYDEETIARQTTRYKVCLSGTMNDMNKVAEVYVDTKAGRKKIYYSVATLDDENFVLIKR